MRPVLKERAKRAPARAISPELNPEERRAYGGIPSKMQYVYDPLFSSSDAASTLWDSGSPEIPVGCYAPRRESAGEQATGWEKSSRLTAQQERVLFLRYNYAKFRLAQLWVGQRRRFSSARAREMITWHRKAAEVRQQLINANLALVPVMAKRFRVGGLDFDELISEGELALLRSVERFDVSRGYKFSTYACKAILSALSRAATKTSRYQQRFTYHLVPDLEPAGWDTSIRSTEAAEAIDELLVHNRADLSQLDRRILLERYGIFPAQQRRTLSQIGKEVGLSKERIRQIEKRSLLKLREALEGCAG